MASNTLIHTTADNILALNEIVIQETFLRNEKKKKTLESIR